MRVSKPHGAPERNPDLSTLYQSVREASARLGAPLSDADATVQSMPDASPAKWHLAHTTWFFERMILEPNLPGYRAFDPQFNFLFNSYYESIGARQPRPRRGMITRPALETIIAYRDHVDRAMASLMQDDLGSAVAEPDRTRLQSRTAASGIAADRYSAPVRAEPSASGLQGSGPDCGRQDRQRAACVPQIRWRNGGGRTRRPGLRLRLRGAAASRAARTL